MPWWYYDKKELRSTASAREGINFELECKYRQEGALFIKDASKEMKLGYNTMATGVVYFHRFYMVHSFNAFPKYLIACCALFLAGKVEETPKKAKDFIDMAEKKLEPAEFAKFGEDPKKELLVLERILLQSIKFDLQVDHPYAFLTQYAKSLKDVTSEGRKLEDVVQIAWNFVNDSLCTTLCLQWEPEVIAVAMLYLAVKLSKLDINNWVGKTVNQRRWWEMFVNGVTRDLLEDICHQVLDYSVPSPPKPAVIQPPPPPPPPAEPMAPLPPTTVLPPPLANPIPNVNLMTNLYPPNSAVAPPPPPQLFTVPPPGILMNPPPGHEGIPPQYHYLYNRY